MGQPSASIEEFAQPSNRRRWDVHRNQDTEILRGQKSGSSVSQRGRFSKPKKCRLCGTGTLWRCFGRLRQSRRSKVDAVQLLWQGSVIGADHDRTCAAGALWAMTQLVAEACRAEGLTDKIVAVEMTGIYHKPVQRAFGRAGFDTRIAFTPSRLTIIAGRSIPMKDR